MSGYQRRTNRGTHPEWWPHIHDLPINTATWNEFVNLPPLQLGEDVPTVYKKDLSSHRPGVKIRLALINFCHSEVSVRRMADVEDICVAEADRLGLNYVGIRQGPHNSESVYTDGCPTMIRDPKTGRMKKMQRQADWHITVVFGHSINELLLHGHIYINWDGNSNTDITIVTDPENQRTFFYDGPKVATQYWGVIRGDTLPLKALQ